MVANMKVWSQNCWCNCYVEVLCSYPGACVAEQSWVLPSLVQPHKVQASSGHSLDKGWFHNININILLLKLPSNHQNGIDFIITFDKTSLCVCLSVWHFGFTLSYFVVCWDCARKTTPTAAAAAASTKQDPNTSHPLLCHWSHTARGGFLASLYLYTVILPPIRSTLVLPLLTFDTLN